ncbi:MAG: HAD-IC family P-type ATPase, partial [Defluviitaleaceae bacterium]|nr:HAD-IC family P-type ATPase [Defluviitaleaceae bacterium]
MDWHGLDSRRVLENLGTSSARGLSGDEARRRLLDNGPNALSQKGEAGLIVRFFAQFKDFMVIILLFAAGLSWLAGRLAGEERITDSLIILFIVVLNAILGVVQESRAKKALEALREISQPEAKVMRDGQVLVILAEDIVSGDIVYLETGDVVPADLRLVSVSNLQVEEASLTGESVPVQKDAHATFRADAPLGDRLNMAFSGSFITYGRGVGVAVATGMGTEIGKIATLILEEKSPPTPLQKKLAGVGKMLGIIAIIICGAIFGLGIWRQVPVLDMFVTSVSLAVAAIPEGLVAIVTIMLAIGVTRMARRNAIIRKLPAVETLGSATVICSDKTGTLTQNKMKIVEISNGKSVLKKDSADAIEIIKLGSLCNDCFVTDGVVTGDPTEAAFVTALLEYGLNKELLEGAKPRVAELPFDSKRKLMTTVHKDGDGFLAITKGAPDVLVNLCNLTDAKKREILEHVAKMADKALRVLAVGITRFNRLEPSSNLEKNLTFVGLAGMLDPPRPEVRQAVAICKDAGIRTVMITGDHAATALAVGRSIGITSGHDTVITGEHLNKMTAEKLENAITHTNIFARVSPEDKLRIVRAFQAQGHTVAMTGDGVNDAPALKAADIGCAMGIQGTSVAKAASDIILTDDNFATIVSAVREGRGILTNIRKAVHFLLSSNIGEIITIFVAILLGWPVPLLAIHLLWVNLVTDSLPAIALGLDPADPTAMQGKP